MTAPSNPDAVDKTGSRSGAAGDSRSPNDDEFRARMGRLGEATMAYDQIVREVIVIEQPSDPVSIPPELLARWRDASDALRKADGEVREMLDRTDS